VSTPNRSACLSFAWQTEIHRRVFVKDACFLMLRFVCFCRLARRGLVETRPCENKGSRLLATDAWQAEVSTQTAAGSNFQAHDLVQDLLVNQVAAGDTG